MAKPFKQLAREITEKTFYDGLGSCTPIRHTRNRHIVGEPATCSDTEYLYPCQFRFEADDRDYYFQCTMTISEYENTCATKFRRERIPAGHPLSIS